jgi:hypothetical protein
MVELAELIARQEMRCEQFIIHVRQIRGTPDAKIEGTYLLALLEDLVMLKAERQRREDLIESDRAA